MLMTIFALLAQTTDGANFGGGLQGPTDAYTKGLAGDASGAKAVSTFEVIISNILGFMTIVAALYFLLTLVTAGINWLGAGGDTGKVQKARDSITNGLIGLVLVVAAYAIAGLIGSVVGIDILSPGAAILKLAPVN